MPNLFRRVYFGLGAAWVGPGLQRRGRSGPAIAMLFARSSRELVGQGSAKEGPEWLTRPFRAHSSRPRGLRDAAPSVLPARGYQDEPGSARSCSSASWVDYMPKKGKKAKKGKKSKK